MVIDSSAIIAILTNEPESEEFTKAIENDSVRLISAANFLEISIVIEYRFGLVGGDQFDKIIEKADIKVNPVTHQQAIEARRAHRTFGKGRHPASLNYGDCFAYALAKLTDEPLLFKGNDFSKTDIKIALNLT